MPAARDLTGLRFGRLTVLRSDGRVKFGREMTAWRCRCDCGAELRVPQRRLTTGSENHQQHACDICRSVPCAICGGPVPPIAHSPTCSPECRAELNRRYQLAYYHERRADDPERRQKNSAYKKRRWAAMTPAEKLADARRRAEMADREKINERARRRHAERMASDPAYAARKQEQRNARLARIGEDAAREEARLAAARRRAKRDEIEMLSAIDKLTGDPDEQ